MGQKVNPHGFRVGIINNWDSRWFVDKKDFADALIEDYKIRKVLTEKLKLAGVPKIEIERDNSKIRINIHCAKPGIVIGKGGTEIEKLKAFCEKLISKPVVLNIIEIKNIDMNAKLVADGIAAQLEKRVSFRRALKQAMGRSMKAGAKGIKTQVSGRLGGAEIARTEHYHEGTIPLQTIRANIDYGFAEAATTYGIIGVKVWIYKGEILTNSVQRVPEESAPNKKNFSEKRPRRKEVAKGGNKDAVTEEN